MDNIFSDLRTRASLFFLALITFSTSTSAIGEDAFIPGTNTSVAEIINLILFWDLGGGAGFWTGLVMFIVVWLGFYFATKPFLQQLFDAMLDYFPSSDSRRNITTNDDGEISGVNMLALLSAFATAQVIGQFFGLIPMVIIGFIPAVLGAWAMLQSGKNFTGEFGDMLSDEEIEDAAQEAERATESAGQEEQRADQEEDAAEEDAQQGNNQQADQEANQAADVEQEAIQDMEIAVQDIEKLMEMDEEQLEQTISELKQTKDEVVYEEEIIEKLEEDLQETNSYLENIQTKYTNLASKANPEELKQTFTPDKLENEIPNNIDKLLDDATALIRRLSDEVKENRRELSTESDEIDSEVKELVEAKKLLIKLKKEVDEGESLDRRIEKLAEKLGDSSLYEEAEYEIEEEDKIEAQLKSLFAMEKEIEKALERELELIERIKQIDGKEIEQMKTEEGEFNKLRNKLPRLVNSLKSLVEENKEGPALFLVKDNPQTPGEITQEEKNRIIDRLNKFLSGEESQMEQIKNSLEQIMEVKKKNQNLVEETENEIKRVL